MMSPAHAMRIHRVPEFAALGRKERGFKTLSGVFQSMEGEVRMRRSVDEDVLRRAVEDLAGKVRGVGFGGAGGLLKE